MIQYQRLYRNENLDTVHLKVCLCDILNRYYENEYKTSRGKWDRLLLECLEEKKSTSS